MRLKKQYSRPTIQTLGVALNHTTSQKPRKTAETRHPQILTHIQLPRPHKTRNRLHATRSF